MGEVLLPDSSPQESRFLRFVCRIPPACLQDSSCLSAGFLLLGCRIPGSGFLWPSSGGVACAGQRSGGWQRPAQLAVASGSDLPSQSTAKSASAAQYGNALRRVLTLTFFSGVHWGPRFCGNHLLAKRKRRRPIRQPGAGIFGAAFWLFSLRKTPPRNFFRPCGASFRAAAPAAPRRGAACYSSKNSRF